MSNKEINDFTNDPSIDDADSFPKQSALGITKRYTYSTIKSLIKTYLEGFFTLWPASATNNGIALYNGTWGKTLKDSGKTITTTISGATDDTVPTSLWVKTYADSLVAGLLDYRGGYNASGNVFPSSGWSWSAGAVVKGDMWVISNAGTLGGTAVQVGDSLIANVDTPGQTAWNWNILNSNISYVPEDVANKATTMSGNTASNTLYLTAKAVYDWGIATFASLAGSISQAFAVLSLDIGHASDSTLTRVSAWRLAIEGNNIIMANDNASSAEMNTGTSTAKFATPDGIAWSNLGIRYVVASLNGTTALTTSEKAYFRIPAALTWMNLVSVAWAVGTWASGSSSSGTPTFTVKNVTDGNQMLSTSLTIDASEYTSATAATPAVINTSFDDVVTDDLIEVACTVAGTWVTYANITLWFQLA